MDSEHTIILLWDLESKTSCSCNPVLYNKHVFGTCASESKGQLEVNNGAWIVLVEEAQSKYTVPGLSLVLVLRLYLAQYGISTV